MRACRRFARFAVAVAFCCVCARPAFADEPKRNAADASLSISWKENYLTVRGPKVAGGDLQIMYLEAYCRPGSTDRDWGETVIGHRTALIAAEPADAPRVIRLRDQLRDGVEVEHEIRAADDAVTFDLVAHNPTKTASQADWAQPCVRLDKFIGADPAKARELYPPYIKNCFLFVDGKLTRLPTEPWATKAKYTPGQVYVPAGVERKDVNPRPVSSVVPSSSLCGCYSADGKQVLAMAWEPCQEVFQGVVTCLHADFRIGGLKPGETKRIRGQLYFVDATKDRAMEQLVERFERDFPEQAKSAAKRGK